MAKLEAMSGLAQIFPLILHVKKWRPEKPAQLGFDAAIEKILVEDFEAKIHEEVPPGEGFDGYIELSLGGKLELRTSVMTACGEGLRLGLQILVAACDTFKLSTPRTANVKIYVLAKFPIEFEVTDAWLEKQGLQRDVEREAEMIANAKAAGTYNVTL